MSEKKREIMRQPNLELLRVVAMFMVVVMHALGHGGVLEKTEFGSVQYIFLWLISTLCQVAVPCFVLISGYFLCMSKFKLSRIIKLVFQVLFYTISLALVRIVCFDKSLSLSVVLHGIFPITSSEYWFITQYFLLICISPLLNHVISKISKRDFEITTISLTVLFSVIPTFFFWSKDYFSDGYDLPWFILLYFYAAYIRLYGNKIRYGGGIYFLLSVICVASRVVIGTIANRTTGSYTGAGFLYGGNSIFMLISSISLFSVFLKLKIYKEQAAYVINAVASYSIGVYLFHNNTAIRTIMWKLLNPSRFVNDSVVMEMIWIIFISLIVFGIGCIIEWFRLILMKAFSEQRFLDKIDEKCSMNEE